MKTFAFDSAGNMTVSLKTISKDEAGNDVEQVMQQDIQASQLKAHMPMFKDEMTAAEKFTAYGIIERFEAQ